MNPIFWLNPVRRRAIRYEREHQHWSIKDPAARRELMLRMAEYCREHFAGDAEALDAAAFLELSARESHMAIIPIFPYDFPKEYHEDLVRVHHHMAAGLPFVEHCGKRLYYRKKCSDNTVRRIYTTVRVEQDHRSPHRYLTNDFDVPQGAVLFDVGAAEADFTLSVIERVSHAYVFEAMPEWTTPLKQTFAPWRDKVTVIPKFAGRETERGTVSIDSVAAGLPAGSRIFIKLDVEGTEVDVLFGAQKTLTDPRFDVQAVICTYHSNEEHDRLSALMRNHGYRIETSCGYMIFPDSEAPYLRRGLIRCCKAEK